MTLSIVWFRHDLRLHDHPCLHHAASLGPVLPVFIDDPEHTLGAASRVWLHHSVEALNQSMGGALNFYRGPALGILTELIKKHGVHGVYWNRCYEPTSIARDAQIKKHLSSLGVDVASFNGSLLWEPWTILKSDRTPYKVFTPFYRKGCLGAAPPRPPLLPTPIEWAKRDPDSLSLDDMALLPTDARWDIPMVQHWDISESGGQQRLRDFLSHGLCGYKTLRNLPAKPHVSRLSPYLRWGQVSPHQVWHAAQTVASSSTAPETDRDHFLSELGWREFSYHLLYHFPTLPRHNLQPAFDDFPWMTPDAATLAAWQHGKTGFPIVDAGMRELWQTGYMHNRVRMIVGSFLVKNVRAHWHHGADWFWDCLFDADLANNSASWQWVAGSGADAAPYFRIFNPITQSENFDPSGDYIRHYVPELAKLPAPHLFEPWKAPAALLAEAGVQLGVTYPRPLVNLAESRDAALAAYATIKKSSRQGP